MRDFHFPGRSPVRATEGMVATSHPLATQAALSLLKQGGNAMDAAVAAAAVLAVVEPQATGIGGDCFVLYAPNGGDRVLAFNGSGRAPAAATFDAFRQIGLTAMPEAGPHSVSLPGAVDAWVRLLGDHGRSSLKEVLSAAIHYAEQGYIVADRVAWDWAECTALLQRDPIAAAIFLPQGRAPHAGELHRQPQLARTLKHIAAYGRAGFYEGWVADDMATHLHSLGGMHTLQDFADTRGEYVEPISSRYRGYDVIQVPPNNQGLTALLMLNMLSGFDLTSMDPDSAERLHLEVEVARLAYRDRDERIADPAHAFIPVVELLSDAYAEGLRINMDPARRMPLPPPRLTHSDTVYLSVVDGQRNAVSFINSIYHEFGSGIVCPASGVVLQNRASSFKLDPHHPNCLAPCKRPMHTIMPGMLAKDGRVVMPFGVMGGDYQPMGQVHVLSNIVDFKMDPQQAIDAPRVFLEGDELLVEKGITDKVRSSLRQRGHRIRETEKPFGGAQAIWIDAEHDALVGASDPRKDGCALGY